MYTIYLRTGGKTSYYKKLASFQVPGTEMLPNSLNVQAFKPERINPSSSNSYKQPIAHEE